MPEINPVTKDQLFEKKISENTGSNYNVGDISDIVPVTKDQALLKEIALNSAGQSGDITELKGKVADNTGAIEAMVNVNGSKNWALLEPESESKDGITFTCTDGKSLTLNGTASDTTGKSYNLETPITGNVIVTLEQTANKVTLSYNDGTDWHTLPADGIVNGTIVQVSFNIVSGTVINETVYLMIRDARITDPTYVPYAMTNRELTTEVSSYLRRTRRDITSNLANLASAVSELNLGKYGYSIGDYFTGASGYTYILADSNTFRGTTTPHCINANHLGIVVDTHAQSQWHSENAATVGYNGSVLHNYLKTTVLDTIKSDFKALFGGSTGLEHLYSHSKLLTTATANWAWQNDQYISALTCTQVDAGSQWTANGYQEGEASKSLELFRKYKWTEIFGDEYPWLRNISNYDNSSASFACRVYGSGGGLDGSDSVAGGAFVVGLINFH